MKTKTYLYLIILLLILSCKKQNEWLDTKSNKSDVIPKSVADYQALLDNDFVMNTNLPCVGIIGSDNISVSDVTATTSGEVQDRNSYVWANDIYEGSTLPIFDWEYPYKMIEYANVVLDGLEKLGPQIDQHAYDNAKGSALFYRSLAYYSLCQLYCQPYSETTASTVLGLPLKRTSNINEISKRSTLQETYDYIIKDLTTAEQLLPEIPQYKTRPSNIAANALLAKVYLNLEDYSNAEKYASKVLNVKNTLIDLTKLNLSATFPFPPFQANNPEIIFYAESFTSFFTLNSMMRIIPELYDSYDSNDLRKSAFFRVISDQVYTFRGKYTGASRIFSGLAINEILLIRAESLARLGRFVAAMDDLNYLLLNRWAKSNSGVSLYTNQTAASSEEALFKIIIERRKEMPATGNLRWEDLRRLNKDPKFAKTVTRVVAGKSYSIFPSDRRYVLPIPPYEINISGIQQNER